MVVREDESLQVLHDMDLQVHGGGRPVTIVPCGRQVHSGVECAAFELVPVVVVVVVVLWFGSVISWFWQMTVKIQSW